MTPDDEFSLDAAGRGLVRRRKRRRKRCIVYHRRNSCWGGHRPGDVQKDEERERSERQRKRERFLEKACSESFSGRRKNVMMMRATCSSYLWSAFCLGEAKDVTE